MLERPGVIPCPPALPPPPRDPGAQGMAGVGAADAKVTGGRGAPRGSGRRRAARCEQRGASPAAEPEHPAQAGYRGSESFGGNQTLIRDKTFACDAFCLVLDVPGSTGGKEGGARECQQPPALAGSRFSMIYSLP